MIDMSIATAEKMVRAAAGRENGEDLGGGVGFPITTVGEQIGRARAGGVTRWLIDGILVEGGSTMVYAQPGHGKSLIALDLALAASEGRHWLGAYVIERQPVLYIDEDGNNESEVNTRLLSFAARDDNPNLHFALHRGFKMTHEAQRRWLIRWCETNGVRLVIMDSLTRLHNMAEGSADEMKVVNAAIKEFTLNGIAVVILHHASKRGRAARGSSEIESGYDAIYRMERADSQTFRLYNTKARSVGEGGVWNGCTITVNKDEDGRLVLDGSQPLPDDEGAASAPVDKAALKRDKMREGVLRLLADAERMTETAMADALGNSGRDKDTFKQILADLMDSGEIDRVKRGKGFDYFLTDELDDDSEDEEGEQAE